MFSFCVISLLVSTFLERACEVADGSGPEERSR